MSKGFQKYINLFEPVMAAMQALLGDSAEFILHDLSRPESSVVAVVGNVTNRDLGAPCTNLVIETLQKHGDQAPDLREYLSVARDGRQLKSGTIFLRDEKGKVVGCFCYNIDLTSLRVAEGMLRSICHIGSPVEDESAKTEVFAQDISEVMEEIIQYEIANFGKAVPGMNRADKLQIVGLLEQKGVFAVKGSAETVAGYLGSSVFTIYNYLKEIRGGSKVGS